MLQSNVNSIVMLLLLYHNIINVIIAHLYIRSARTDLMHAT
jgi:hypothetical protein